MRLLLSLLLILGVMACSQNTQISYRLVDETENTERFDKGTIGLRDVHLPEYWSDRRIPIAIYDTEIKRSDKYMLAENPNTVFYRAFRSSLQRHNTAQVFSAPWPPKTTPEHRIEIFINSLIGELGGSVRIEGYVYVVGSEQQIRFSETQPTENNSMVAYMNAIAAAIDESVLTIYANF